MSSTAPDSQLFVEDVVTALTGAVAGSTRADAALKAQMKRAAADFDKRTAEAFARALLEHLCAAPDDVRSLEALLILGLAHPHVLEKHRVSLETEGRRLAILLERGGEPERARCLLETIAVDAQRGPRPVLDGAAAPRTDRSEHVERRLREADKAASGGRLDEAIALLREVVAIDPERRDVARMIRDLRFQQTDRGRGGVGKGLRRAGAVVLAAGLVAGVVVRERAVARDLAAIAPAAEGDLESLRARLDAIDALVASEHVWLGMHRALLERGRLASEVRLLEETAGLRAQEQQNALRERAQIAEDARTRGQMYAQQGRWEAALADFRRALAESAPGWEHRARVQADVDAIEAWTRRKP